MPLILPSLDTPGVRSFMLDEVQRDIDSNVLLIHPYIDRPAGAQRYAVILRNAVLNHTIPEFADKIRNENVLADTFRHDPLPGGTSTIASVPKSTADDIAAREFSHFYVRGLCNYALASGILNVRICKADPDTVLSQETKSKIGQNVNPEDLLSEIRDRKTMEHVLGLLPKTSIEITVRL